MDNDYISNYKLYFIGLYLQVRKPFIGLGPGLIRSVFFAMPQNRKKQKKRTNFVGKKRSLEIVKKNRFCVKMVLFYQLSGKKEGGAVAEGSSDSEIK